MLDVDNTRGAEKAPPDNNRGRALHGMAKMMLATAIPEGFQPAAVGGRYVVAAEEYDDLGGRRSAQGVGHCIGGGGSMEVRRTIG